jgi:hypothetical protein
VVAGVGDVNFSRVRPGLLSLPEVDPLQWGRVRSGGSSIVLRQTVVKAFEGGRGRY